MAKNGKASVNFEHGWGDGVAVLRYFNEIYDASLNSTAPLPTPGAPARELGFEVNEAMASIIARASSDFEVFRNSVECKILQTQVARVGGDGNPLPAPLLFPPPLVPLCTERCMDGVAPSVST